jgi:hypothetical protein
MEHESFEFKIVMDDAADTEVLARASGLDIASAAYMAAVAKYPLWNVQLRGAQIIKRHDDELEPTLARALVRWAEKVGETETWFVRIGAEGQTTDLAASFVL